MTLGVFWRQTVDSWARRCMLDACSKNSVASGRSCRQALPEDISLECILIPFRHVNQTVSTLCDRVWSSLKDNFDWPEQARNTCGSCCFLHCFESGGSTGFVKFEHACLDRYAQKDSKRASRTASPQHGASRVYAGQSNQPWQRQGRYHSISLP